VEVYGRGGEYKRRVEQRRKLFPQKKVVYWIERNWD